jgi:hypothetical protein
MAFDGKLMFADPVDGWRRWFAWRPIKTANAGWVWLRFVDWRPCVVHAHLSPGGGDLFWQYRG